MVWYEQINRVLMVTMLVESAKVRIHVFLFLYTVGHKNATLYFQQ